MVQPQTVTAPPEFNAAATSSNQEELGSPRQLYKQDQGIRVGLVLMSPARTVR